jgi:hypothetical protein
MIKKSFIIVSQFRKDCHISGQSVPPVAPFRGEILGDRLNIDEAIVLAKGGKL